MNLIDLPSNMIHIFLRFMFGKEDMRGNVARGERIYRWVKYIMFLLDPRENYESLYGYVDYKGKTVLDVGADYGSSAFFFLEKGAKKVYAVERNEWLAKKLRRNAEKTDKLTAIKLDVSHPNHFDMLLKLKPDIAKVDIELGERHLLGIDNEILSSIPEYLIETHTKQLFDAFSKRLQKLGYIILRTKILQNDPKDRYITLFYAVKNGGSK